MGWSIYEVICEQFEKIALYTPYYWRQYQVVGIYTNNYTL